MWLQISGPGDNATNEHSENGHTDSNKELNGSSREESQDLKSDKKEAELQGHLKHANVHETVENADVKCKLSSLFEL